MYTPGCCPFGRGAGPDSVAGAADAPGLGEPGRLGGGLPDGTRRRRIALLLAVMALFYLINSFLSGRLTPFISDDWQRLTALLP